MAVVLFIVAGFLVGGVVQLVKSGATKFSVAWSACWRRWPRPAAWPGCCRGH